jgi:uncharacterized protein YegP (UPF0339 family)
MVPKQFVLYRDARGEWRWSLYAPNSRKIADSAEGYLHRQDAIHGARLVAGIAADAPIWEPAAGAWVQ